MPSGHRRLAINRKDRLAREKLFVFLTLGWRLRDLRLREKSLAQACLIRLPDNLQEAACKDQVTHQVEYAHCEVKKPAAHCEGLSAWRLVCYDGDEDCHLAGQKAGKR